MHALRFESDQNEQFAVERFDDLQSISVGSSGQLHLAITGDDVLYTVEGEPTT